MGRIGALIALAGVLLPIPSVGLAASPSPARLPPAMTAPSAGDRVEGVLPNGLRYILMRRETVPGEVDLRLAIHAGSMNEQAGEEGLAHFLEHMAFRGSAKYQDGEVMRAVELLGLRPGADANAATGPVTTTYMFDLPRADAGAVDKGLGILRDIVGDLTLAQDKIDLERGVVLAEGRDRSGPQADLAQALRSFEVGDHPFARPVIGRPDVIAKASSADLRRFYDAYYRPERSLLVVVGDIDPALARRRIEELFGSWRARGAPGRDPSPSPSGAASPVAEVATIPGSTRTGVLELWPQAADPSGSAADPAAQALAEVEDKVVDARLAAGAGLPGGPYAQARIERVDVPGVAKRLVLSGQGVRDPRAAIGATLTTVQQLKALGISQAELDAAIASRRAELARSAESSSTQPDRVVAANLLAAAVYGRPYLGPVEHLKAFDAAVAKLTPERMSQLLARDFASPPSRVLYYGPTAPLAGREALVAEILASNARTPAPFVAPHRTQWVKPQFGPTGVVAERRYVADLNVTFVRFQNGVKLTVKPTKFAAGQAIVQVRFGHGRLDLSRERAGPESLAALFLTLGGVRDMTRTELAESLQGKAPPIEVLQTDDAFVILTARDALVERTQVPQVLDVMAQQFSEPGWREAAWRASLGGSLALAKRDEASPAGVMRRNLPLLVHAGDARFAALAGTFADGGSSDVARGFLEQIMRHSPPEVVVVGDVDVDEVVGAVAGDFGALALSGSNARPPDMGTVQFPPSTPQPVVLRHHGKADEAAIEVSWPTTDRIGHLHEYATGLVLADVVRQRLTDDLRQRRGEVYSPTVVASFSPTIPGYGRMDLEALLKPDAVPVAFKAIDEIAADLMAHPVAADEFNRAQRPRAETLARLFRRDDAWAENLAGAQDDPRKLDFLRRAESELARVTPADLQAAAKAWLGKDKSWRLSVLPDEQATADSPAACAGAAQPACARRN